jgi:hypothetical protein
VSPFLHIAFILDCCEVTLFLTNVVAAVVVTVVNGVVVVGGGTATV